MYLSYLSVTGFTPIQAVMFYCKDSLIGLFEIFKAILSVIMLLILHQQRNNILSLLLNIRLTNCSLTIMLIVYF